MELLSAMTGRVGFFRPVVRRADDPVLAGLRTAGVPFRSLPIGTPLRSNITLTEPDSDPEAAADAEPVVEPVIAEGPKRRFGRKSRP